jgi:hypothetical protein
MSKRNIMVVGLELPWPNAEYVSLKSRRSLLDGDIIVIHPVLTNEYYAPEPYQGKPCYDDSDSFQIRESIRHWRDEIVGAFNAKKTIIVFLAPRKEFFIATGQKDFSGTGRNRSTTRLVEPQNNYSMIPYVLKDLKASTGAKFKRAQNLRPIERYWNLMESSSQYCVTFEAEKVSPLLTTPDGSRVVAGLVRSKGCLVLVPHFARSPENDDDYDRNVKWTAADKKLAGILETAFVAVDTECRSETDATVPPDWVSTNEFRLPVETEHEDRISLISNEISKLQEQHQKSIVELDDYKLIKSLLFEKGKSLEVAVRSALQELGFEVTNFKDDESEFDAVFSADGFRFLGEVEGKDDKAINVDKMSQLERNISEDFEKDNVSECALGVLFGNAFRTKAPLERPEFFTEKVLTSARRTGTRLVRTTDLFHAVKAIRSQRYPSLAADCRKAIYEQAGRIVQFPIPEGEEESVNLAVDDPSHKLD